MQKMLHSCLKFIIGRVMLTLQMLFKMVKSVVIAWCPIRAIRRVKNDVKTRLLHSHYCGCTCVVECCPVEGKMWRWDLTHFNRCSRIFNVYIALWIYHAAFGEKFTMHDSFQVPKHCEHYFSGHVLCSDFFVACRRWMTVFYGLLFQFRIIMTNPWLISGDDILKKLLTFPVVAHEKLLRCLLPGCFHFISKQLMHPFGADLPVIQLFDHFIDGSKHCTSLLSQLPLSYRLIFTNVFINLLFHFHSLLHILECSEHGSSKRFIDSASVLRPSIVSSP